MNGAFTGREKDSAHGFPSALDETPAALMGKGGKARQRGDLPMAEGSQFGKFGKEREGGHRPHAAHGDKDLLFCIPDRTVFDQRGFLVFEVLDLPGEPAKMGLDAFTHTGICDEGQTVFSAVAVSTS